MRSMLFLVLGLALAPTAAAALTVQDVVALSKAGVPDAVVLAMIERDQSVFALDAAQVIALQRDGIGEQIVMALLKSGRDEKTSPVAAGATATVLPVEPLVVGVGHGPEVPNTFHDFDSLGMHPLIAPWLFSPTIPFVYPVPFSPRVKQRPLPVCSTSLRSVASLRAASGTCRAVSTAPPK